MSAPASQPPKSDPETDDGSEAINITHALAFVGFLLRRARRRWLLTTAALLVGAVVTASAAHSAPRSYMAEAKVLAQRQVSIPLLTQHTDNMDLMDAPARMARETRAATEVILRRDNLVSIIEETKLADRWDLGRTPLQRLMDAVNRAVRPPVSRADRARALVGVLEKKIGVKADETTITITLSWHHPEVAHQLLTCVLRNFLADRGAVETAGTAEAIRVLEEETGRQREAIDAALSDAEQAQRSAARAEVSSRRQAGAEVRALAADDIRLSTALDDKRRAIQLAEDTRQRQLVELMTQLDRLRVAYTPEHPAVVAMEERIRAARAVPADLAALKRQEAAIVAQIKAYGPKAETFDPITTADQPKVSTTRAKLLAVVNRYEDLMGRLESARLELTSAQATFKHRYVVAEPPETPTKPDKPIALIIFLVGTLLTTAIALSLAGLRELGRGRFIEPWQARRKLPLPLLAEVEEP